MCSSDLAAETAAAVVAVAVVAVLLLPSTADAFLPAIAMGGPKAAPFITTPFKLRRMLLRRTRTPQQQRDAASNPPRSNRQ